MASRAVLFAACTAARIGEVPGCRVGDLNTDIWTWTVRRQTTTSPGGLIDKAGAANGDARLSIGPRGGRISTAVLRDATHWDEVVTQLGYEHLRRHDLRHTGLTWMADAGVPVHHLQKIAGHGQLTTTQRYLHPNRNAVTDAGELLSNYLRGVPNGSQAPRGADLAHDQIRRHGRAPDLETNQIRSPVTTVDVLRTYLNRTDLLHDLREAVRQLDEANKCDTPTRSVTTISRRGGRQRKLSSRLTDEQVRELVATFEAGSATRLQLAERYGISRTSVAKVLRDWRRRQAQEGAK